MNAHPCCATSTGHRAIAGLLSKRKSTTILFGLLLLFFLISPVFAGAGGFKFKVKNTAKTSVAVFYKITTPQGKFKLKTLIKLRPGEEKIKAISVAKNDTIAFYGQDAEDETSVTIKKTYDLLLQDKDKITYVPIIIPEKQISNFESLEGLSVKLEHNKVLNFLLKMDSTSMSSLSMLEKNFQNVYPLGTFIFVDVKTNRLLLPPLEPSFWNSSENYLTIQDSLYAMVNKGRSGMANAQVAYFVAKMFDSLRVNNTAELEFKAKLSLIRWKPTPAANIYQVFNDKSVEAFLQNCYAQIDNPDQQYQRYRLYFLSSYERIDDLEIFGRQYYNFGNEADLSIASPAQVFSTNLGVMYTKNKTLSNYYSVQNAVLRTKAYDFTSLLFNSFKKNVQNKIIAETRSNQHNILAAIVDEYKSLVAYNPDPVKLTLQPLDPKDPSPSIVPIQTTVRNLSPYTIIPPDTAKTDSARTVNDKLSAYNNKVKFFNSHLTEIQTLFKELDQTDNDLEKLSHNNPDKAFTSTVNSPGLLKEIEVNSQVARKE
ncbi:hypothetical protein [Mucilaginibacter sp. L3T2-6]|uniref:hypothetical protein n=1 Tax=Mucilaginibacter sp. L3T2-6 TaxID=3062491 RepID=UPI0026749B49|nr:hypothetical protein [Mucilaginibacter sp. L3T2-6]MDO3643170.1 hypothetical protein [Mucilaginibacter sp. L3T2-6]MDV6215494.1 hypothetical protein [Mucilaginibacter sp. L3T2-6]